MCRLIFLVTITDPNLRGTVFMMKGTFLNDPGVKSIKDGRAVVREKDVNRSIFLLESVD
jgi:hypothetical protein